MKNLLHSIFPSLKPKYFIIHGVRSNPYGETVFPIIFDANHDREKAEKMVKNWMDGNMKRGFWDCHDAKFSHTTNKYSFKSGAETSKFMMGRYDCVRNMNNLKYFSGYFSGDTNI